MKMLLFGLMCVLVFASTASAQKKYGYWSIGFNPLSMGESMSSAGPCMAYRISPRVELWGETSFIFYNLYQLTKWQNLKGYRFIFQPRYYTGKKRTFFVTPELRIKQFSYNTALDFINASIPDTLKNYPHKSAQFLIGGALVFGKQFVLSLRHHLFLEITAGVGAKQRYITRKNIPAGYEYKITQGGFGLQPHYEWNNDGTPYFPLGVRLIWKLTGKG